MKTLIKIILVAWKLFALLTYFLSFEKPAPRPIEEYTSHAETDIICMGFGFGHSIEGTFFILFLFIGLPFALSFGAFLFLSPSNKPCVKTPATLDLN